MAPNVRPTTLAVRLRELRSRHWPGRSVRQPELAEALRVSISAISSWESPDSQKYPTMERLYAIATFYASRRSLDTKPPRLLADDELTDSEREAREALYAELSDLRARASGQPQRQVGPSLRDPWRFADGGPVRIVCGKLDKPDRSKFESGRNRNYMALAAYADLDALIELFGHIRAKNPNSDVRFDLADRLESDDLQAHLVLLGNIGQVRSYKASLVPSGVPIRQISDEELHDTGEIFEVMGPDGVQLYRPRFAPDGSVTEDVGYFMRTHGPINSARTLTICSGVFTRGVYGAVRLLTDDTDPQLQAGNLAHVAGRLDGAAAYGVLLRVPTHDHAIATPDLRDSRNVLFDFDLPRP